MSEEVCEEDYEYDSVVVFLMKLLKKYKVAKHDFYEALHREFLRCPNFSKLCRLLDDLDPETARSYFKSHGWSTFNEPLRSEKTKEGIQKIQGIKHFKAESVNGKVEIKEKPIEIDNSYDRFVETNRILSNFVGLGESDFKVSSDNKEVLSKLLDEALDKGKFLRKVI